MLIIFSEIADRSASKVTEWLAYYKVPFVRINCDDAGKQPLLSVKFSDAEQRIVLNHQGKQIEIKKHSIVWFRRGRLENIAPQYFNWKKNVPVPLQLQLYRHFHAELKTLYDFFYFQFQEQQINTPVHYVYNKLAILSKAKEAGLSVPDTMITTKKTDVRAFIERHNEVITKNIQDIAILDHKQFYTTQGTIAVTQNFYDAMPETFGYSLFQKSIHKKYEVRTFYYNERMYSIANFSQQNANSIVDGRTLEDEEGKINRLSAFELPAIIKTKLIALMQGLGMNTGSIDWIITPENNFVFLEVNPVGQFDYVSVHGNFFIEQEIALDFKRRISYE